MTDMADLMLSLQRYLEPGNAAGELTNLSMGWESDVYGFTVTDLATGRVDERVLRLYFGQGSAEKAARESTGMRLLRRVGYPVPEVYAVERGAAALGRPFLIMQRVPGDLLWPLLLRRDAPPDTIHLARFCALMVQLHTLNWDGLSDDERARLPRRSVAEQLAYLAGWADRNPLDGISDGIEWLGSRQGRVSAIPPALLHWDLHPANVLFAPPNQYSVIDWTQAEFSDPRFDLAWTVVLVGSQASWPAAEMIQAEYVAQGGSWGADLDFFVAAACLKRLFSVLIALTQGAEVLGMRPSAEKIMLEHLDRIAQVYNRWLEITGVRMAEADRQLAAYL